MSIQSALLPVNVISSSDFGFAHRFEPATVQGAPCVLLLHGTGGDENSMIALGKAMAPGAALLSPRGQVIKQGMTGFIRRKAEGDFEPEDLETRTKNLQQFIASAGFAYGVPPGKLVVAGFSNGAIIAASLLLQFPETLAGAVLMRGMMPYVPQTPINLQRRPVLMLNSTEDPIVGTDEVAELADMFRAANADVTLHWETAGHTLSQGDVLMAFDWMRKFFTVARTSAAK